LLAPIHKSKTHKVEKLVRVRAGESSPNLNYAILVVVTHKPGRSIGLTDPLHPATRPNNLKLANLPEM
jgi:hypothetical protein